MFGNEYVRSPTRQRDPSYGIDCVVRQSQQPQTSCGSDSQADRYEQQSSEPLHYRYKEKANGC